MSQAQAQTVVICGGMGSTANGCVSQGLSTGGIGGVGGVGGGGSGGFQLPIAGLPGGGGSGGGSTSPVVGQVSISGTGERLGITMDQITEARANAEVARRLALEEAERILQQRLALNEEQVEWEYRSAEWNHLYQLEASIRSNASRSYQMSMDRINSLIGTPGYTNPIVRIAERITPTTTVASSSRTAGTTETLFAK